MTRKSITRVHGNFAGIDPDYASESTSVSLPVPGDHRVQMLKDHVVLSHCHCDLLMPKITHLLRMPDPKTHPKYPGMSAGICEMSLPSEELDSGRNRKICGEEGECLETLHSRIQIQLILDKLLQCTK